jgi:hypothetical protein
LCRLANVGGGVGRRWWFPVWQGEAMIEVFRACEGTVRPQIVAKPVAVATFAFVLCDRGSA